MAVHDVHDYGAQGLGGDDSDAIRACFEAAKDGDEIVFRAGVYGERMRSAANRPAGMRSAFRLRRRARVTIRGEGPAAVIRSLPEDWDQSESDRHTLVLDQCERIRIEHLTIDGNRHEVTTHKDQSHGIEVIGCDGLYVEGLEGRRIRADLIRLQGHRKRPTADVYLADLRCYDSGRSVVGLHGGVEDLTVNGLDAEECTDQFLDLEPRGNRGAPRILRLSGLNVRGRPGQIVISLAGISQKDPLADVVLAASHVQGVINVRNFAGIKIADTTLLAGTGPAVLWNGWGEQLSLVNVSAQGELGVRAAPQGRSAMPRDLKLDRCRFATWGPAVVGDRLQGLAVDRCSFDHPADVPSIKLMGRGRVRAGGARVRRSAALRGSALVLAEGAVSDVSVEGCTLGPGVLPIATKGRNALDLTANRNAKIGG